MPKRMKSARAGAAPDERRFAVQAISVLATKLTLLGSGLLASVIIARALGPSGLGVFTAVIAVVTVTLTLADLGVRQATAYLMGKRAYDTPTLVANVLALLAIASVVAMSVVALVFALGPARSHGLAVLLPAVASVPLLLTIAYAKGVALGKGWIARMNLADLWNKVAFLLVLGLLLVLFGEDARGTTLAYAFGAGAGALVSLSWLRCAGPLRARLDAPVVRRMLSLGVVYALVLFMLNLNYRIDVLLIEGLLGPEHVGLYAVGVRFAELVWQLPAALSVVLFSSSARAASGAAAIERTLATVRTTLPLVLLMCAAIALAAPWFLPLLFGAEFSASATATRLLMPGVATAVVFKLLYADLAGRGRPAAGLRVFAPMAAANVMLNLALIPRLGIEGAAVATTLTYAGGAAVFAATYARSEGVTFAELFVPRRTDFERFLRRDADSGSARSEDRGETRSEDR